MKADNTAIEEAIRLVNDGLSVTFPVNGRSMLPFIIGGRESVVLVKPANLRLGDVVLAWSGDREMYVVHRIIAIDGDHYTLMGDGNICIKEYCSIQDIKARITHVVDRHERKHDLYSRWRMLASRLWIMLRPVRPYLLYIYKIIYRF